ncbi:MAG: hypothetical protein O6945_04365 [Gammaproteobacteria bacterium]|nr:hypothetical protein [Gammaproteobacteria bacterium]
MTATAELTSAVKKSEEPAANPAKLSEERSHDVAASAGLRPEGLLNPRFSLFARDLRVRHTA